ncbi:helix-turn-helix transcriptional regulator [Photobacterium sp. OFAV2-7]|uniref:ArsR/SmtB family transcription factor n=1 Tax=Photobacterium sp. OFAV2-7 TaxID=2917748 RepID=UPI001EF44A08|nr:winged helix-turn-helix domain-containing protein [Photobacterium sp. OFAV2-7]MCG7586876.1 winged helix-turn-helix domain-containing protein [Photobacterium sp. OFAV2-7]
MSTRNSSFTESENYSQETDMAALAAAMSDASRMKILCALMDGRAWTATELSAVADIAASTTSSHLSRLVKANLVSCLSQGRHRYFRLYNSRIASLLENMMGVTFQASNLSRSKVPEELLKARTCYDHLAGEVAVKLYESLITHGWIESDGNDLTLQGKEKFLQLGITLETKTKRKKCCPCLDWSERKFHVGGFLGASLLNFFESNNWIEKVPGYREVTITPKGYKELHRHFLIED